MMNTPNYSFNYPWGTNNYTNMYPTGYSNQTLSQNPNQILTNGIIWVQGESGAKSYQMDPNQTVLLLDSENDVFYIKQTDNSGMPLPLRIFDYKERIQNQGKVTKSEYYKNNYVTKDEFEKRLAEITNGKQYLSTTKQQQ